MKEVFIEEMNMQIDNRMDDADYQYNAYLAKKTIEELNDAIKPKYSDSDIKYTLDLVLGDANPLSEKILYELNELYNLRHDF